MALLEVNNLRTEFAMRDITVAAVDDVSFVLNPGECLGIVGESGCGKTTTGLSVMRLLPRNGKVADGNIIFDGTDLSTLSEKQMEDVRGNAIALIPQDPLTSLNPVMRIGAQIGEGFRIHRKVGKAEALRRSLEVLKLVEMPNPEERLHQYPHELSGGLRQRVMIAMALVCEPKVLIADEPTTALDVTIQAQILDLLESLRESLGMAMILITHDMGVIAGRTDRVAVMYAGKKIEESSTAKLFSEMRHPYSQALLASVPELGINAASGARLASIDGLPPDLSQVIVGCRFAPRCAHATEECWTTEPPLEPDTGGDPAHLFACFNPIRGRAESAVVTAEARAASLRPAEFAPMLKVEHLVKEFPVRSNKLFRPVAGVVSAVADVSFELGEGETFGLVGESGCGKTTIGRLIVGLEEATSGTIAFNEKANDVRSVARRRDLATERQMMFQDPYSSLDPRKRVNAIIGEPLSIHHLGSASEQRDRVAALMAEVGLPAGAGERFPHEFSGGQRQRIGLARALALEPKLIIADEPVSALDVSIQAQILNLMIGLREKRGLSLVMISHDLAVVQYVSDRIGVMYLGKLVEMGPANEVFQHPAHHYTQGLLDAVPVPDVDESKARRGRQVRGELPSASNPPSGCRFRTRCPRAEEKCAAEEPPMSQVDPGHIVACHFPLRPTTPLAPATTPVSISSPNA
jgi:oligopeptide/dipeptide ABC transporter ATP-binding protein